MFSLRIPGGYVLKSAQVKGVYFPAPAEVVKLPIVFPSHPITNNSGFLQMHLLNDYHKPCGERPKIYAAVINVVLAMGYRIQLCEHGDVHSGFNEAKIKACVDNAQMMLDELMIRDQDTLGLQALLGLVSK